jgi:hypothetical protein
VNWPVAVQTWRFLSALAWLAAPWKSGGGPLHSMTLRDSILDCASSSAFTTLLVLFLHSAFYLLGRVSVLSSGLAVQSQRDCALQPKVAPIFRGYLGSTSGNGNNANSVVAEVTGLRERNGHNRVAVGNGSGR